jgi:hypothetical protein
VASGSTEESQNGSESRKNNIRSASNNTGLKNTGIGILALNEVRRHEDILEE